MRACWIKLTTGAVAPRPSCFRFNAVMRVQFTLVKARCQSALAGPTLASDESRGTFAKVDADAVKYNLPFLSFSAMRDLTRCELDKTGDAAGDCASAQESLSRAVRAMPKGVDDLHELLREHPSLEIAEEYRY